uniref:arylamine N-acetyltransferase n=1 Tax=Oncorhynchus tshawytscha TaxID=74940 RepID=A0AAZ3RBT3_ONCTS
MIGVSARRQTESRLKGISYTPQELQISPNLFSKSQIHRILYKFTLDTRHRGDFIEMCDYHQSSPSSIFFCKSLCSMLKPTGRLTYMGHKLITTQFPSDEAGTVTKASRELTDEEIPDILKEEFGIILESQLVPKDETMTPPLNIF